MVGQKLFCLINFTLFNQICCLFLNHWCHFKQEIFKFHNLRFQKGSGSVPINCCNPVCLSERPDCSIGAVSVLSANVKALWQIFSSGVNWNSWALCRVVK